MKTLVPIILLLVLGSCKKNASVSPSETFEILPNQYIKITNFGNTNTFMSYSFEKGGSKHIAYYMKDEIGTMTCNDCGNPFIAFEFDPSLNSFSFTTASDFEAAKAIKGLTSSIAGPRASYITSGKIEGKKIDNNTWSVTMKVKTANDASDSNIERNFRVK